MSSRDDVIYVCDADHHGCRVSFYYLSHDVLNEDISCHVVSSFTYSDFFMRFPSLCLFPVIKLASLVLR